MLKSGNLQNSNDKGSNNNSPTKNSLDVSGNASAFKFLNNKTLRNSTIRIQNYLQKITAMKE